MVVVFTYSGCCRATEAKKNGNPLIIWKDRTSGSVLVHEVDTRVAQMDGQYVDYYTTWRTLAT